MGTRLRYIAYGIIFFAVLFASISCKAPNSSKQETASSKSVFNNSDKSIITNGNLPVAVEKIQSSGSLDNINLLKETSPATLTKAPYSAIGKLMRIKGKVYKVEEMPPDETLKGSWTEILMLAPNPNSPLGVTTIDFMYKGNASNINSGDIVNCSGYFIGTFESKNAMGGSVESVVIVGNQYKLN